MKTVQIELTDEVDSELLKSGVAEEAQLSEWIADAIQRKLEGMRQIRNLENRASRGQREKAFQVLSKVAAIEPHEEDRL
jgi:hypothetical protein